MQQQHLRLFRDAKAGAGRSNGSKAGRRECLLLVKAWESFYLDIHQVVLEILYIVFVSHNCEMEEGRVVVDKERKDRQRRREVSNISCMVVTSPPDKILYTTRCLTGYS